MIDLNFLLLGFLVGLLLSRRRSTENKDFYKSQTEKLYGRKKDD
jgi:hypothetical protein